MNKLKFVLCGVVVLLLYCMPAYGTTEYEWNFGDGKPLSNKKDPAHVYDNWGKYDWTLTVTRDGDVCVKQGTISINQYEWDFGDGTYSYEKNPNHQYTEPGEYTWSFTYIDCHGEPCTTWGTITITSPPSTQGSLTLTSPNGEEELPIFKVSNIAWTQENVENPLKITLLKDGEPPMTIAENIDPAESTYPWYAGVYDEGTVLPGSGYTIKIEETGTELSDTSDASFTILDQPVISITSPRGGETWPPNKIRMIEWYIFDVTSTLKITLSKDGEDQGIIADGLPPNSTYFPWTVGNYEGGPAEQGTGYTIKIQDQENSVSDTSGPFTISDQPAIWIISPNGGETWSKGFTHDITWGSSNVSDTLEIILRNDDRDMIVTIVEDLPATTTSYSWTVGTYQGGTVAPGNGYTIKIKEKSTTVSDTSDNSFSIINDN